MKKDKSLLRHPPFQTVQFQMVASSMGNYAKEGDMNGVVKCAEKLKEMAEANKLHWLRIAVEIPTK